MAGCSDEGVKAMPRMPEIVGETQDVVPALTEKEPAEPVHVAFAWKRRLGRRPETAGILGSPQRMRLTDFSGMGERAPPVDRRWGVGGKWGCFRPVLMAMRCVEADGAWGRPVSCWVV